MPGPFWWRPNSLESAILKAAPPVAAPQRARLNERLKVIGQTDSRVAALEEIVEGQGRLVQRELAQRLGVEEPTIVGLLDALEAQDRMERLVHCVDRRAKIVLSKPAADQTLGRARTIVASLQEEYFSSGGSGTLLASCPLRRVQSTGT